MDDTRPDERLDEVPLLVDPRTGEPISRREVRRRDRREREAERRSRRKECDRPECEREQEHRLPNGLRVCERHLQATYEREGDDEGG